MAFKKMKPPIPLTEQDKYERELIAESYESRAWYKTRHALFFSMSRPAVELFCFLAHEVDYHHLEERNNGWLYSTCLRLEIELNMSPWNQHKYLTQLKNLGVIEFSKKGNPGKRYVWINWQAVKKLMDASLEKKALLAKKKYHIRITSRGGYKKIL